MKPTIGVLCHALDVRDPHWRHLVWGNPQEEMFGRAATAIRIAVGLDAKLLVFLGGNWFGANPSGPYTHQYAIEHAHELDGVRGLQTEQILFLLRRKTVVEHIALTTREELNRAGEIFAANGITQPILVSSPYHLPRAHLLAMETWKGLFDNPWAIPSDTNLPGKMPSDTLVFEPEHPRHAEAEVLLPAKAHLEDLPEGEHFGGIWTRPDIPDGEFTKWKWIVFRPQNLVLGEWTDIGALTTIFAHHGVEIGARAQIGSHCSIYSINTIDGTKGRVVIGAGARVGSHSTVLPGVTIGAGAKVGAGSVVTRDIPAHTLAVGAPAKVIRPL